MAIHRHDHFPCSVELDDIDALPDRFWNFACNAGPSWSTSAPPGDLALDHGGVDFVVDYQVGHNETRMDGEAKCHSGSQKR
jgi:hypothetical protein